MHILERREYTGCIVNFKTYTNSIWNKKQHDNPVENQAIFPASHERIIEDDVFEKVQKICEQRHRKTKTGRTSMFSGLVFCSDCGEKLYYGATNNYRTEGAFFDCSVHWKHKDKCRLLMSAWTSFRKHTILENLDKRKSPGHSGLFLQDTLACLIISQFLIEHTKSC